MTLSVDFPIATLNINEQLKGLSGVDVIFFSAQDCIVDMEMETPIARDNHGLFQMFKFMKEHLSTKNIYVSTQYSGQSNNEDVYKMWYGSTIDWTSENGEMIHVLKYATSENGHDWEPHGLAIPYELGTAQAFSKPCVIRRDDGYHMWFSYRSGTGTPYRLGYSFSRDGQEWSRTQSTLSVSNKGWDSDMVCYPYVFEHKNILYMLYNGNQYGREGFGLAYALSHSES